jgi:hypothetical protein
MDILKEEVLDDVKSVPYLAGRGFEDVVKMRIITYPVRCNKVLKLSLVEAALGVGFNFVDGTSELLAAVHHVVSKPVVQERPVTITLIDCGGGSCVSFPMYNSCMEQS